MSDKDLIIAALEHDYTAEPDNSPGYENDAEEYDAALANVKEMHRLLNVRQERLLNAYDEVDDLRGRVEAALTLLSQEGVALFHPQPTTIREHPIPSFARDRLRAVLRGIPLEATP
jgi:hypothetical protein